MGSFKLGGAWEQEYMRKGLIKGGKRPAHASPISTYT
jgi:hypothetical protein